MGFQALGDHPRAPQIVYRAPVNRVFGLYGNTIDLKTFAPLVEGGVGSGAPHNCEKEIDGRLNHSSVLFSNLSLVVECMNFHSFSR
jgi:hypothetical protein